MKTYDSSQVNVNIGPISISSGRAKGPFVRIANEANDFEDECGADGETVRWAMRDDRATITLILMNSSESNQALSALRTADKLAANGAGIVPLFIQDGNGDTIYEAKDCWIQKAPDAEFGQEPGTREWTLRCAGLVRNDSGS